MTDARADVPRQGPVLEELPTYEQAWATPPGWRILSSVSHRVVGQRFIVTGLAFFLIAGFLAILVRTSSSCRKTPSWMPRPTTRSSPCTAP